MKKPMTIYKSTITKQPKYSFIQSYYHDKTYAENGKIKTYANKTQAENKVNELNKAGFNVAYTTRHPFLIFQL